MARVIEGTSYVATTADDHFRNPDGSLASWVEETSPLRRWTITVLWALPGAVFTVLIWVGQAEGHAEPWQYILGLIPFAFFAFCGHAASPRLRRKYSMTNVVVPHGERLKQASKWTGAGLLLGGLYFIATNGTEKERWVGAAIAFSIFAVPGLVQYLHVRRLALTPEALKAKSHYIALTAQQKAAKEAKNQIVERAVGKAYDATLVRAFGRRGARYVVAVVAFSIAGYLAINGTSKNESTWALLLAIAGAMFAWDALLWLIAAGMAIAIVSALFSAVAALPVSIAIIIGALIIASAVSSKK